MLLAKIKKYLAVGLVLAALSFYPTAVFAAPPPSPTPPPCDTSILPCDLDIAGMLRLVINILSGLIGVAAVGSLVYAGILYTTAGGDTEKTKKAIEWIRNTVIGIVAYAFMYLILNFVIPGGFAF